MTTLALSYERTGLRGLARPAIATIVMLAMLVSLGVWQLQRRQWKLGLLAEIDRAEAAPPVALPGQPAPFAKVVVSGLLQAGPQARYGAAVRDVAGGTALGAELIQVLSRPGQVPILVDRGWVPDGTPAAAAGEATIVGYVRPAETAGLFSLTDDVTGRRFYTLDPVRIGAALGLGRVAPFTLVALVPPGDSAGALPQAATALPRPPNDHLNYALTWFGLALSLLVVFAVYCRRQLRA